MARNITLTLGAGLGADLGPNFNLTANVGSVTPSTATKSELTAGKSVSVDDAATQVTVTSTGTCTNAITQTIPCAVTTTTTSTSTSTSTSTTTTTTTEAPVCNEWNLYTNGNSGDGGCFDYIDCTNTPQNVCVDNSASVTICAFGTPSQSSGTGINASNQGPCAATTTTTTEPPTTTTTTTAGVNYISYPANKYGCSGGNCGSFIETTEIAFPDTFTVTINKWYVSQSGDGYAYELTSTTASAGPGLIMQQSTFNTCGIACSV